MPITKLGWVEKPKALERYLAKQRDSETIETSSHGLDGKMAEGLKEEHARFQDSSRIQGMTIIQSWKEEDRHLYPAEKFNEMGQELASRLAPGHAAWVFTHTDKDNIHNHIVICSVHADTGKRIENKKALLFKMRELNDDIARENGFKTLDPSWKEKGDRLPAHARAMVANGKSTWRHALNEKTNFVRAFSTSFDEYAGTLKTLGVHVRVEDKNISYVYGDRKAIRGKSLGTKYTKEGLIKAFKENDERIASNPALRNIFANHLSDFASGKSTDLAGGTFAVAHRKKDYEAYTKVSRASTRGAIPEHLKNAGILAQEFKKAQDKSIFDYCKANKIGLLKDRAGQLVLTGRESIVVEDKRWKNTRNHDSGGLVEFVKLHDDSNFLRAVAKINNNPRLLLLESVIGEYSKGYRSFHFPKEKKAQPSVAEKVATQFLKDTGRNAKHVRKFTDDSRLMVSKNHSIWLRSDRDSVGIEITKEENGTWKKRSNGNVRGGFCESIKHSLRMTVFTDPFDFVLNSKDGKAPHNLRDSFFVMSDESSKVRLYEILFANPHIKEVQLISPPNVSKGKGHPQLFNDLKAKLTPFDIQVKELSIEGLSLGLDKSKSPDL